jgi:GNAT superfamily N-acetyltransferase
MSRDILIRAACRDEANALTALVRRSKEHWGYDEDFMTRSAAALRVRGEAIADGRVLVACDASVPEARLGVAELAPLDRGVIDLDKLFVDPPAISTGVGARLLTQAARAARTRGARRLTILADPHAAGFYERMGARFLRMAPSDSIPGRQLPFYDLDLDQP